MFRTSYVHHQEDYIVHTTLYNIFFHAFMQAVYQGDYLIDHIGLHVQYSIPDDEHKMFETCRRQDELS